MKKRFLKLALCLLLALSASPAWADVGLNARTNTSLVGDNVIYGQDSAPGPFFGSLLKLNWTGLAGDEVVIDRFGNMSTAGRIDVVGLNSRTTTGMAADNVIYGQDTGGVGSLLKLNWTGQAGDEFVVDRTGTLTTGIIPWARVSGGPAGGYDSTDDAWTGTTINSSVTVNGYGYFDGESLSQDLRVGGIYGDLGLYIPSSYNMQFDLGGAGSNFEFTQGGALRARITGASGDGYFAGNVGIGSSNPLDKLYVAGTNVSGSDVLNNDGNDRPGVSVKGSYPEINLITTEYTNTNHGATLRFVGYKDANRNSWNHWVIGTGGNASNLDFGFSANSQTNPHLGIANYDRDWAGTSGDTFMRITSAGRVGIGTTAPIGKLHVYAGGAGGVGWGTGLNVGDSSNYTGLIQDGGVSRWRNTGAGGWDWYNSSASTRIMALDNSGNFFTSGLANVGNYLQVNGKNAIDGTDSWLRLNQQGNFSTGVYTPGFLRVDGGIASGAIGNPGGGNIQAAGSVTGAEMYTSGWFRNNESGEGLYNGANGNHFYSSSGNYWNITAADAVNGYPALLFRANHNSTIRGYVYSDPSGFGLLSGDGAWRVKTFSEGQILYGKTWMYSDAIIQGNTYLTGNLSTNGDIFATANYGLGLVGVYSDVRYQNVWAMGTSWRLPADGTTSGNLYGLAWTHSNIGGQSKPGLSHQLLVMENGTTKVALGSGIWTSGNIQTDGNLYVGSLGDWLTNRLGQDVRSSASTTFNSVTGAEMYTYWLSNRYGVNTDHPFGVYFGGGHDQNYAIFRESGAWTNPYPDMRIAFHTGIKIGAHSSYNGIRFYNNSDMVTETMSIGDTDNNVRVAYALYVGGAISAGGDIKAGNLNNRAVNAGRLTLGNSDWHNWGTSVIDGRVWSSNSNIHLSPANGYNVEINTKFRDAGGPTGGTAGLIVSGKVGIGMTSPTFPTFDLQLVNDSAGKPNGGSWANSSDVRLKKNFQDIDGASALDKLSKLQGKTFEWINPENHAAANGEVRASVMAQNLRDVFPQWVSEIDPSGKDKELIPEGEKALSISFPNDFNAYLIEAIKELKKENDNLRARVEVLENK